MEILLYFLMWYGTGAIGAILLLFCDFNDWKEGVSILDVVSLSLFACLGFLAFVLGAISYAKKKNAKGDRVIKFLTDPRFKLPWKKRGGKTDV